MESQKAGLENTISDYGQMPSLRFSALRLCYGRAFAARPPSLSLTGSFLMISTAIIFIFLNDIFFGINEPLTISDENDAGGLVVFDDLQMLTCLLVDKIRGKKVAVCALTITFLVLMFITLWH